ncbi:hypothetical protein GIB64_02265 [Pseudomonas lactis]|uniref:hypothetical protein n=1 Tax=Pseudomonas TaxID=286 RepID=UPI000BB5E60D|nr:MULTISPECIES: hypothetical protein [Pseudomonas]MBA5956242.1 hypothetical protein [Pseudomonas lactis]PRW80095.1 hypothetical protein C7A12_02655 [Pseudomonas fluorescens]PRW80870.1 hypothetical protein C7A13_06530 [Pseudomonas fluorescens]
MSAFYDRMAATALRLIERFGLTATLSEVAPGEYDPVTGVETGGATLTQTGQLILLDYTAQEAGIINAAGSLVQQGDKKIMLAAKGLEWPPTMTTTVLADGLTWTIINIKSTNPAGTPLVYELHGRR